MISVDQALKIVQAEIPTLAAERVELDLSLGRILAEQIRADIDLPPFDRSRMDGYAVRSEDVQQAPVTLTVVGEVAAGSAFTGQLERGQAVKIFTGSPVPGSADAVQKIEVTEANDGVVRIDEPVKHGQFIARRASEAAAGQVMASAGREISAQEISVLASFGYGTVQVTTRPRVAVLSTGSELVDVALTPSPVQIRNSNAHSIAAYARRDGADVTILGTAPDTPEATRSALVNAGRGREIVITTGGVSMGDYDLVKATLKEIGAEIFFDTISIRPGKPTVFARWNSTYFFGLPGNPVSMSVTYNLFVRPAIRKMLGEHDPLLPVVPATLVEPLHDASSRRSYLPGRLSVVEGQLIVRPMKWTGSSDLVAFMNANTLIIVHEEVHELAAGSVVNTVALDPYAPRRER